jgi:hypothetical protein
MNRQTCMTFFKRLKVSLCDDDYDVYDYDYYDNVNITIRVKYAKVLITYIPSYHLNFYGAYIYQDVLH